MLKNPRFATILILFISTQLLGRDLTRPFGWATQGGGTTGGEGGAVDTVDGASGSALEGYLSGTAPHTVYLKGAYGGTLDIGSNKTLIGLPGSAMGSLTLAGSSNIILRNLTITNPSSSDGIRITESDHLWIDHCNISNASDGNLDITHNGDFITVSFCIFEYDSPNRGHRFSNLIAASDGDAGEYRITYVYNWWRKNVDQRMPRMRYSQCHIVNNLYTAEGNSYCVGAGHKARPLIEGNVFIGVNNPIQIRSEGTASLVEARNNIFTNTTGTTEGPGQAFVPPYELAVMPPEAVEEYVGTHAGPVADLNAVGALEPPLIEVSQDTRGRISIAVFPMPVFGVVNFGSRGWTGADGRVRPQLYRLPPGRQSPRPGS